MIALIAALDNEVQAMVALLEKGERKEVSGIEIYEGKLSGVDVVLLKSGVGIGFAAMVTTIALENYKVDTLINIGTAGGLKEYLNELDVVVSTSVVQHNYDALQIVKNETPGLCFTADNTMIETSKKAFEVLNVPAYFGLVASGDQFVYQPEQIQRILHYFPEALCAEMEAGGIAQVCNHYKVPFVVIRSLSDIAVKEGSHMDFSEYVKLAAQRSADFTSEFIKNWMCD